MKPRGGRIALGLRPSTRYKSIGCGTGGTNGTAGVRPLAGGVMRCGSAMTDGTGCGCGGAGGIGCCACCCAKDDRASSRAATQTHRAVALLIIDLTIPPTTEFASTLADVTSAMELVRGWIDAST